MNIKLNNRELELKSDKIALGVFLREQDLNYENGVAIAINDNIIPKHKWEDHYLNESDNILLITAAQGG